MCMRQQYGGTLIVLKSYLFRLVSAFSSLHQPTSFQPGSAYALLPDANSRQSEHNNSCGHGRAEFVRAHLRHGLHRVSRRSIHDARRAHSMRSSHQNYYSVLKSVSLKVQTVPRIF